ncbi:MAG: response regulator [Sumerlaeia bacterium]
MNNTPFSIPVDALKKCETEQIRIPGCIQPFGCLIVYSLSECSIIQLSANTQEFLGRNPKGLLGEKLTTILEQNHAEELEVDLQSPPQKPELISLNLKNLTQPINAFVHQIQGVGIIEIEKSELLEVDDNNTIRSTIQLRKLVNRFCRKESFQEFIDQAANVLREISGYERVCVYQFIENNHGFIVGESTNGEMEEFKGLKFPNFDIPSNSRALYMTMRFGHVPDINYAPVELTPPLNPVTNSELNLTYCLSRSHSPNCRNYYQNLSVRSNFSASIIVENKLWGLFTFHHREKLTVSITTRTSIDLIIERICSEITMRSRLEEQKELAYLERIRLLVIDRLLDKSNLWPNVLFEEEMKLNIVSFMNSSGYIYYNFKEKKYKAYGNVPSKEVVSDFCNFIAENQKTEIYHSTSLAELEPKFTDQAKLLSGFLSISFPYNRDEYIIWILPEEHTEIKWSGVPTKEIETVNGEHILHPRKNFEAWIEETKYKSRRWTKTQIEMANKFRDGISIVLLYYKEYREELLNKDLLRMSMAIEYCGQPIIILNQAEDVIYVNNSFKKLFGFSVEELNQEPNLSVLIESKNLDQHELDHRIDDEKFLIPNLNLRSAEGKTLQCSFALSSIFKDQKELIGKVVVISDLTNVMKLQDEQRELEKKMLEFQKLESLRILAGGVAHDFNNLLVGILGSVGLAKLECSETDPIMKSLNTIENASERAADLTKQMLAYSGQGRFLLKFVELNSLISDMLELLMSSIKHRSAIRFQPAPWLPKVEVDEIQIHQIILNTVMNAAEAAKNVESVIQITTSLESYSNQQLNKMTVVPRRIVSSQYCCITVNDSGIGMDSATLSRLFEPFYTTKLTGRGLGMAAVHGIVRSHDGFIELQSQQDIGTTIKIGLPVVNSVDQSPLSETSDKNILIIDDEFFVHEVLNQILERLGIAQINCYRGDEAIELLAKTTAKLDLIMLDMNMPGLNGKETLEKIDQFHHEIPVILMSGYNESDFSDLMIKYNVIKFVSKPFKPVQITELLNEFYAKNKHS